MGREAAEDHHGHGLRPRAGKRGVYNSRGAGRTKTGRDATRKPEVLRVRLLGGFRVSVGSRSTEEDEWRLKKAKNLVKLLALTTPRHRLHREQVMTCCGRIWTRRQWPTTSTEP